MNNKIVAGVVAVIILVAIVGCYVVFYDGASDDGIDEPNDDPNDDQNDDVTVTFETVVDSAGNTVSFDSVPERIVSMGATITEMLCELGLIDSIVGVQSDSGVFDVTNFIYGFDFDIQYPDELKERIDSGDILTLGRTSSWTFEQVMVADPDVVIFSSSTSNLEKMEQLQEVGVVCIVLDGSASSIDSIYENMELLGKVFGRQDTAELFNTTMQDLVSKIYAQCEGYEGKDVIMISYTGGNFYAYAESNLKHVVLRELGCTTNMAGSATGVVTVEHILEYQPDVIIIDPMGQTSDMTQLKADIESDPLWADVLALQNNDIYYLEYNAYQCTGYYSHHFVHGIALMACIVFDEFGSNIPNLVPGDTYVEYLAWIEDL